MKLPPVTCKQVKSLLKNLGFEVKPRRGTSHEQWVHQCFNGKRRLVTVDCPKQPFSHDLMKFMAAQAGCNARKFWEACVEARCYKELINAQS